MNKYLLLAAVMLAGVLFVGCSKCKKSGCKTPKCNPCGERNIKDEVCRPDGNCGPCRADYCKTIGVKMADERVRKGEEVKFDDGVVVRSYPKDKITKW